MKTRRLALGVLLFPLLAAQGCVTSPTGRKQLIFLPEGQVQTLGAQSFQQIKTQTPVSKNGELNSYVQCIAKPLLEVAHPDIAPDKWEIVVFDDPQVNAFALPGGKIGVYTGLFKVAQTPGQVAAVLGHEIGHVIARHGNERVSREVVTQFGQEAIGAITHSNPHSGLIMAGLGLGTQVGIALPFSRSQESEADVIGLKLMSEAGFDPHQALELWKNMMKSGGGAPPEILSDHPADQSRLQNLQSKLPEDLPLYEQAPSHPDCGNPPGA
jgi:predicted Zn-dependent protease